MLETVPWKALLSVAELPWTLEARRQNAVEIPGQQAEP